MTATRTAGVERSRAPTRGPASDDGVADRSGDATQLTADALHRACDASALGFESTAELDRLDATLYQDDALAALDFGLRMASPGYNVFVLGERGSGRRASTRAAIGAFARNAPPPEDTAYVYNFDDPKRPRVLMLPTGRAIELRGDVSRLIPALQDAIRRLLQSDAVVSRRSALIEEREKEVGRAAEAFERELSADEFVAFDHTGDRLVIGPARGHEAVSHEAFVDLPQELRSTIEEHVRAAHARHFSLHRKIDELRQEAVSAVERYHHDVIGEEVGLRLDATREKYRDHEPVLSWLTAMSDDIVEHVQQFLAPAESAVPMPVRMMLGAARDDYFARYDVNVIASAIPTGAAPAIEEPNPTLINLLGGIDHRMAFGVMTTDFTRIAAGAVHRANGGFLMLDAEELLSRPLAWPALKRVLRTGEVQPAEAALEIGVVATDSLRPEPVPIRVKVVLIGEPRTYYLLQTLDGEFRELFKVKADFRPRTERTPETERGYAAFIGRRCGTDGLPHLDAAGVARIVEEGSRLAGDQNRLTTRMSDVDDLVREAAQIATAVGSDTVSAEHVEQARVVRERRNGRPHRELLDLIGRGVLRFEPAGDAVGELYGIGLITAGDTTFGRPIRVMASAFMGTGGVVDIEREAKLSGPIHHKGILVLSGYLGRMFARERPLVVSASLSFDQLYEEVEGDSASAAELYALMSAMGSIPLHTGVAITGAVNQDGRVLPVGGVTEKVEGFFAACERVGLTGQQGVILPRSNLDHLVLRKEVREAVGQGRFHVWAIDRIEQGWPVLAGVKAGSPLTGGGFSRGSVNDRVWRQLELWADQWQTLAGASRFGLAAGKADS